MTIEGIAARAGVAKQTIYRWWAAKTDILFDALAADAAEYFIVPDHGDLGRDLRDQSRPARHVPEQDRRGRGVPALAGQAQHDPAVATRFEAEFVARAARPRPRAVPAGPRPGELNEAADIDLAIDQLAGPVYYRVLVTRQSVGPEFTGALVERYLAGSRDR